MKKNFISIIVIMLLLLNTIFPIIVQAKESENIITKNMRETNNQSIETNNEDSENQKSNEVVENNNEDIANSFKLRRVRTK